MSKRKVPETSLEAWEDKKGTVWADYAKIIKALQSIGIGNYDTISIKAKLDRHAVGRRLSEMRDLEMVVRQETTSLTRSGHKAANYTLSEKYTLKVDHPATQLINKTKEAKEFINAQLSLL